VLKFSEHTMFASLPMYDLPEIREATDGFWLEMANLLGVNLKLYRGEDWSAPWHSADLLFSQTCGYPYTHAFAGQFTYVATPHYLASGCEAANYCSILFSHTAQTLDSLRYKTAAINTPDSMSGMLALKLVLQLKNLDNGFYTGSHVASLQAVQSKKADVCAIDCVTVGLLRKYRPSALEGLVELGRSPQVPGLPYITRGGDISKLREALLHALQSHHAEALLLTGMSVLPSDAYSQILKLEASLDEGERG
jgi:ABC-type phosphate/phosphonate transport system substrate-binding protein